MHLVGGEAAGQPGEFLSHLADRLIGDPLSGLDEVDIDLDPAGVDPLVEFPDRLLGLGRAPSPCLCIASRARISRRL